MKGIKHLKKKNPRRRPASMADVKKAHDKAAVETAERIMAIVFMTLKDKHGFDEEQVSTFYSETRKLLREVNEGRVSVRDMLDTLKDEYQLTFEFR